MNNIALQPDVQTREASGFLRGFRIRFFVSNIVPLLMVPVAVGFHYIYPPTLYDVATFLLMSFIGMFSVAIALHRYLTHHAFKTSLPIRWILLVLGATAGQGPPIFWVTIHRRHHEKSDHDGDPHSPRPKTRGVAAVVRGLAHAHFGWMFSSNYPDPARYAKDLLQDPTACAVNQWYFSIFLAGLVAPALFVLAVTQSMSCAFAAFLWGGPLRHLACSHLTWSVNSFGHAVGARPCHTNDGSRNLWILAVPTLGDSWHNNHHAFPSAAVLAQRWWQIDLGGLMILAAERLGLVWDVKRANHE